ncbi:hypothetical protein KCU89_g17891, partial [Aureobasidium melanogenum]
VKNKALTGMGLPSSIKPDPSRIAVWGHSFGGAAAAQVSLEDASFKAGINFDGTLYGSVVNSGIKQPFLIFSHTNQSAPGTMSSWQSFLQASPKFDKLELSLNGSTHYTFTDAPLLADLAGLDELPGVDAALGQLSGTRVLVILAAYTDAFFRTVIILEKDSITSTYGHSQLKTGHPVRSAIHKQLNGRLVLRWVTTWESLLL